MKRREGEDDRWGILPNLTAWFSAEASQVTQPGDKSESSIGYHDMQPQGIKAAPLFENN